MMCKFGRLSYSTFRYVRLPYSTFRYVRLSYSTFRYVRLPCSTFRYVRLSYSTFRYVRLPYSTFRIRSYACLVLIFHCADVEYIKFYSTLLYGFIGILTIYSVRRRFVQQTSRHADHIFGFFDPEDGSNTLLICIVQRPQKR
jgi:hypothetical protein